MNIYKVTRISQWDYDQYSSFVCVAKDDEQAKNINPSFVSIFDTRFAKYMNNTDEFYIKLFIDWKNIDEYDRYSWVKDRSDLTVTFIGTTQLTQVGVILASYHAG
jgi:hypothetical protein